MKKRITVREIAERAGVNPATVSRALKPETAGMISVKAREKIMRICDELDYRPSCSGRSIVTGKTYKIGMILGNIEQDLHAHDWTRLTCGLTSYLQQNSYNLLLLQTQGDIDGMETQICHFLMSKVADGYIMGPSMITDRILDLLRRLQIPLCSVCDSGQSTNIPNFIQRDDTDAFCAVWRKIPREYLEATAYFSPDSASVRCRIQETLRCAKLAGVSLQPAMELFLYPMIPSSPFTEYPNAFQVAKKMQKKLLGKKVIFCSSDFSALGLCDALKEMGVIVGKDIFVVGYGDLETYPGISNHPYLSTISASAEKLGITAGKMILDQIAGIHSGRVIAKTKFIQRKSFPKSKRI